MPFAVEPLHPIFAARVTGLDLTRPLLQDEARAVMALMDAYAVCVYPNAVPLTDDQHIAFSRNLGPMQRGRVLTVTGRKERLAAHPELVDVGNLDPDGNIQAPDSRARAFNNGNRLWHTDMSFHPNRATYSLLNAHVVPPQDGDTEFADERAAYDALSDEMKRRLDALVAEHSIFNSRAKLGFTNFSDEERQGLPPVPQVLVRTLPEFDQKSLYLASHAGRILGMPEEEGRALIDELVTHATQRQFIYTHRWRVHDLVIWDNRCTMHRGTDFDDLRWKRDMQRATVCDMANSCEQAGIRIAAA